MKGIGVSFAWNNLVCDIMSTAFCHHSKEHNTNLIVGFLVGLFALHGDDADKNRVTLLRKVAANFAMLARDGWHPAYYSTRHDMVCMAL